MDFLIQYQWEIFIAAEILSFACLIGFGVVRYLLDKRQLSSTFLLLFIVFLVIEAMLALLLYNKTGEIETFQIVVMIFLLYACTFGILDFKKLDRWMRMKIGKWRGVELLTPKDLEKMARQKDPRYIAKKYRMSSMIHLFVFVVIQAAFWIYGTSGLGQIIDYMQDLSWIGTENVAETPYANEVLYRVSLIWGIVFVVDFIWSWSYTFFPAKEKGSSF